MPYRKDMLAQGEVYHVFTKSIAGFKIFNAKSDYERMTKTMLFYSVAKPPFKLSFFISRFKDLAINDFINQQTQERCVQIIAYCFMPTHIHLVLRQLTDLGISKYMNLILKSYAKYFNLKHKRKGPLWEGRFKSVLVENNEQLLHLTRYVHLNPFSAGIITAPDEWFFSSYRQYIGIVDTKERFCKYTDVIEMSENKYKKFVEEQADYQRTIECIKHLCFE